MNDERTYQALVGGYRIPRKHKLEWLGRKLSKKKLRQKIEKWHSKSDEEKNHSYFCPNCGEGTGYVIYEPVEYPERYAHEYCLRCHTETAVSDNSPWYFTLDTLNKES